MTVVDRRLSFVACRPRSNCRPASPTRPVIDDSPVVDLVSGDLGEAWAAEGTRILMFEREGTATTGDHHGDISHLRTTHGIDLD